MIPSDPLFHKPKAIIAAKNILYATMFLTVIDWVVGKLKVGFGNYSNAAAIVILILALLAISKQIGLGMKWARTIYAVLSVAGMILLCFFIVALFKSNLVLGVLFLLEAILQILALKFLFSQESTLWFNKIHLAVQDRPKQPAVQDRPKQPAVQDRPK